MTRSRQRGGHGSQGEEVTTGRIGGCVLALVGVAVAVCSVIGGLMGFYGAAVDGHAGAEGVYLGG